MENVSRKCQDRPHERSGCRKCLECEKRSLELGYCMYSITPWLSVYVDICDLTLSSILAGPVSVSQFSEVSEVSKADEYMAIWPS